MSIVEDYYSGNTHIVICDDYCVKTQEEIDSILDRIGRIWANSELNAMRSAENK